ncbi:MAG: cation:proton antiporter [Fusobacteriaceae bacterium]
MNTIVFILGLAILGVITDIGGRLLEKLKLPSLIGMMLVGMFLGPSFLNKIPVSIIKNAPTIKDLALITVLFIGGLGISSKQMKQIGRPAILLSIIPATMEGFAIAYLATIFLNFTFVQGAILGFIIAAVSPAVLIPSMISLIKRKKGQDKAIPQMLLVGASADDTVAITLFTTFLTLYLKEQSGVESSLFSQIISIPLTLSLAIIIGLITGFWSKKILKYIKNIYVKTGLIFSLCVFMRVIEKHFHWDQFNSLLAIMIFGFYIRNTMKIEAKDILKHMNWIWQKGKLYLFALVGMAINPTIIGEFFFIGVKILSISLSIRAVGVLISLIGTNLTNKEKFFCVIAYLPKATVQSAKAGIPLQYGVAGGEIMQGIAILSVLITAPLGAIGIKLTSDKCLKGEEEKK